MSDIDTTQMDESGEYVFDSLDIAELRKYSKLFGIAAQRDWKKEDFVRAIKNKQQAAKLNDLADNPSSTEGSPSASGLKPGEARILIHRDPTPGAANGPVQVGLNGRIFHFPRGIAVTVPLEYVGVLADAKETRIRQSESPSLQNPAGVVVEEEIQSYPFQVLEINPRRPGDKFYNNVDQRAAVAARKDAFRAVYNKWPTSGELMEFERGVKEDARLDRKLALEK